MAAGLGSLERGPPGSGDPRLYLAGGRYQGSASPLVCFPCPHQNCMVLTRAAKGRGPRSAPDVDKVVDLNNQAGGVELSNTNVSPRPLSAPECEVCGRKYKTMSGLYRHRKTCGVRDRSHCVHCGRGFATFQGVRQHEKLAHRERYMVEAAGSLPPSEASAFELMAEIEVGVRSNQPFLKDMALATGLTVDQVRYRRKKPAYREFLEGYKRAHLPRGALSHVPEEASSPNAQVMVGPEGAKAGRQQVPTQVNSSQPPGPSRSSCDVLIAEVGPCSRRSSVLVRPKQRARRIPSSSSDEYVDEAPRDDSNYHPSSSDETSQASTSSGSLDDAVEAVQVSPITPPAEPVNKGKMPVLLRGRVDRRPGRLVRRSVHPASPTLDSPLAAVDGPFIAHLEGLRQGTPAAAGLIEACLSGCSNEHLLALVDEWLRATFTGRTRGRRGGRRTRTTDLRAGPHRPPSRGPRASLYKKTQDLWQKNRSALVGAILNGGSAESMGEGDVPEVSDVEKLYGGIFESISPPDEEPLRFPKTSQPVFLPVTPEEVGAAKRGWNISAPGPDGIGVAQVRGRSDKELAVLYTIILWKGLQPTSWRASRTVLIHKEGDKRDASNWRPITIGSAVQRLWHRLLSRRLRGALALNQNQRGFVEIDGTMANVTILDSFIRSRTESGRSCAVVSLDIRKAFDTVSHWSLDRALRRYGVDEGVRTYIMGTFTDATTIIKVGRTCTRELVLRRGVKQGDPLSPLLFNMVVDELLDSLNGSGDKGAHLADGVRCAAMAFADDFVLLEEEERRVPNTLAAVEGFFRARGMEVNPRKSVGLCVRGYEGRSIPRVQPVFRIGGQWIRPIKAMDSFRYLGHQVGSFGVKRPNLHALQMMLERVHRAPLKPDQKLSVLRQYLIPRLLYGFQNPGVTGGLLTAADRLIKRFVKRVLHFNIHTPDAVIHAAARYGGLGVYCLRSGVPFTFYRRLDRLGREGDPVIRAVMASPRVARLVSRIRQLAGDVPPDQVWKERLHAGQMTAGLRSASGDPASSAWLRARPHGWSGRDFVRAVQLRTENLPVVGVPYNPQPARQCRGCHQRIESLSHVLQGCPVTHGMRIRRHDEICRKVARHVAASGMTVEWEPHVRARDGALYKPDLVIHTEGVILVVDVQVSWESVNRTMSEVWDLKRRVYDQANFREAAARRWPGGCFRFCPLILGARGFWPRCNQVTEDLLRIPGHLKASCVNSVLKWGSSLHSAFMRTVWA